MSQSRNLSVGVVFPGGMGLILVLGLMVLGSLRGVAQNFSSAIRFGVVEGFEISEASGLAASRQNPGVLWTHNDNNYVGTMFALSTNGAILGQYSIPFVFYGDFEDMAIGPGPNPDFQYLYLGDIGDNTASRPNVRLFRTPEPAVYTNYAAAPFYRTAVGWEAMELRYPDGAFDAEALMMDPNTGDLYLATKQTNSARIYMATRAQLDAGGSVALSFVRQISFFKVSGGDISFDGKLVTLRRGGTVWMWNRGASQTIGEAFGTSGKSVPVANEENGEAIAFHPTGLGYFTLSEGYGQTNYYHRRTDNGVARQPVVLIPPSSAWRYDDSGTDRGAAWRALDYDDAGWAQGAGQLGYGEGDEITEISYGLDDFDKNPTTYFRRRFTLGSVTMTNLALRLCFSDGVAVYLNGTEVLRRNLPADATYRDLAVAPGAGYQNVWQSVAVSPSLLRVGTNVVAVELHRHDGWGPELSFDLQLIEGPVEQAVRFADMPRQVAGQWQIKLLGPAGALGVVEGSSDLRTWSKAGEVVLVGGQGTVTDATLPPGPQRFYRVKR